jgi:hypothetical protein
LFRADVRTDMTKLVVTLRNFANAPKNTFHWRLYDFRLPPGLHYEVITFGLLPSVAFLWFLTNVSGPYIGTIFRVQ